MNPKAAAIKEQVEHQRDKLDQLVERAADEGINIKRETTDELVDVLTSLRILEEQATPLRNTQLMSAIRKERDRCRVSLGLAPATGRRRR